MLIDHTLYLCFPFFQQRSNAYLHRRRVFDLLLRRPPMHMLQYRKAGLGIAHHGRLMQLCRMSQFRIRFALQRHHLHMRVQFAQAPELDRQQSGSKRQRVTFHPFMCGSIHAVKHRFCGTDFSGGKRDRHNIGIHVAVIPKKIWCGK